MGKLIDAIGISLFESEKFGGNKVIGGHMPYPESQQD